MNRKFLSTIAVLCLFSMPLLAQTLNVGTLDNITDSVRRAQLLGIDSSNSSNMIRPVTQSHLRNYSRELYRMDDQIYISALPVVWKQQFNSHHPYGWNDGAMIRAKGYQTSLSAGFYAKIRFLSIQFQPEVVYARNTDFRKIYDEKIDVGRLYYVLDNMIDMPVRFGDGSYKRFDLGQSSVRVTFDPVSFGLSNENLWWGPGKRNSLLMSNNAPGFKHATLNTTRPINTPIGAFEAQAFGGRLDSSGVARPNLPGYTAKPRDWRYISGFAMTYNPKWLPNLYLGFEQTNIAYKGWLGNNLKNYIPLLSSKEVVKTNPDGSIDLSDFSRDQLVAFNFRWVWPDAKAEIYAQYGREDRAFNGRDAALELEHSRAYVLGFQKLVPFRAKDEYIQIGVELTQMESAPTKTVRPSGYWYTHSRVRHGYTNIGQVLGAGIGPGSNLQSIDVSWVKGLKRIGIEAERLVNNNDLMYFSGALDYRRHWVDLGVTTKFAWDYKNFVLNSGITYIHSFSYNYQIENAESWSFIYGHKDKQNLHIQVGLMYRL